VRVREQVCVFVRESVCVCVCVMGLGSLIITVCFLDVNGESGGERERECVCVRAREIVCVCVCE